jgi:hypothetical protein
VEWKRTFGGLKAYLRRARTIPLAILLVEIISLRTSCHCEQFIRTEVPCDPARRGSRSATSTSGWGSIRNSPSRWHRPQGLCSIQLPASHGQSSVREKKKESDVRLFLVIRDSSVDNLALVLYYRKVVVASINLAVILLAKWSRAPGSQKGNQSKFIVRICRRS